MKETHVKLWRQSLQNVAEWMLFTLDDISSGCICSSVYSIPTFQIM